jgi:hypothetical protein
MNLRYELELDGRPAGTFAEIWQAERAIPAGCRDAVIYVYDGPILQHCIGLVD